MGITNADAFKRLFGGLYATELWSWSEDKFLEWLNGDYAGSACNWNDAMNIVVELTDTELIEKIRKAPIVMKPIMDVVPVVHGKWECLATEHNAYRWQVDAVCSCCGFVKYGVWSGFFPDVPSEIAKSVALRYASKVKPPRYCESCGARMNGERRDAE